MNKQEEIRNYKVGQKVAIYGYIDAIDIENISDIENTTTLRIKTPVKTISINPKYEEVVTDFNKSKLVVPQFVANWYEENKDGFEMNLYNFCVDFHERKLPDDLYEWFNKLIDKQIETLVLMHKFGYEVEKEKLYTVGIPNPNSSEYRKIYLAKNKDGEVELFTWSGYMSIDFADNWKQEENAQLTETEIKKDFGWAWQFAEEVEE